MYWLSHILHFIGQFSPVSLWSLCDQTASTAASHLCSELCTVKPPLPWQAALGSTSDQGTVHGFFWESTSLEEDFPSGRVGGLRCLRCPCSTASLLCSLKRKDPSHQEWLNKELELIKAAWYVPCITTIVTKKMGHVMVTGDILRVTEASNLTHPRGLLGACIRLPVTSLGYLIITSLKKQ